METTLSTSDGLSVKQWSDKAFAEYLSILVMAKYMGMDEGSLIQVNEDLMKMKGDAITFSLVGALKGSGVQGDSSLQGNEEKITSYSQQVVVDLFRNATLIGGKMSEQRYPFQIRDQAKPRLNDWKAQFDEDKMFTALGSIDGTDYSAASAAQKNSWNVNNQDRVLYGATTTNFNATHATALANVDATNDVLNTSQISLAKRLAKLGRPRVRPLRVPDGPATEVYVMFAHPYCTRDLKQDSNWKNAQQYSMERGSDNPLFTGAIGMWDGVIVVETDKVALLDNVGTGAIDVAQNFLCGAQALLWAQGGVDTGLLSFVEEEFDYKNKTGVAIESMWGCAKARFGTGAAGVSKDHGVVTTFSAGVAD